MHRYLVLLFFLVFSLHTFANRNDYPPITPENIMDLRELEIIGKGSSGPGLAWSPDGSRILTGGSRGIFIFDSNYQNIDFIDMGKSVSILRFAPHGSFVFAYFDGTINAFDLETRTIRYQLNGGSILAISQDERLVAYSTYRAVVVADLVTGETHSVLDYGNIWLPDYSDEYTYRRTFLTFAQFFNDDEQLLIRWTYEESGYDWGTHTKTNDIWTLADGSHQTIMDDDNPDSSRQEDEFVAFDSNNESFRLGYSLGISYWRRNAEIGRELFSREANLILNFDNYVKLLDDNLFAIPVGSLAENESLFDEIDPRYTVILDIQTGELVSLIPASGLLTFSPDKAKIAIGSTIFDLRTGQQLAILQTDTYHVLLGISDRILQYGSDDTLRLLDAATMEEIAILPMLRSEMKEIREIFSDGSFLLVHQNQQLFIRVSAVTGQAISHIETEASLIHLHLSQNEQYFSHAYEAYRLEVVWNADTGEQINIPVGFVPLLSNFEANQLIGWTGQTIAFYDLIRGDYSQEISLENTVFEDRGQPSTLQMSPDGQYLIVFFNNEGLVINRNTAETLVNFAGGTAFNPSSNLLAYSDEEWNIWILNLDDGQIIQNWHVSTGMLFLSGLYFPTDEILNVHVNGPDSGNELLSYNAYTGQALIPRRPQQPHLMEPFAEVNGLRFYNTNGLRIEWNEQPISMTLKPEYFGSAALSSDASLLYMNYTDGRIGIWGVSENQQ